MKNVRTRFAVSPTGYMHVGGIRNALFDWLIAKQAQGKFIVRLEDTDQKREVAGADQHIYDTLHVLNINYDEGPDVGGNFGPYKQSERLDIYKKWAQKLVDAGRAYADPYSTEEVQKFREEAQKNKKPFLYREYRPDNPPKWDGSQPLRFKSEPKDYTWHDKVMGKLSAGAEAIDDFILIKSDGYPTYNFCHIIDDHLMEISHVIRSQEFLASVPKYLNLYEALDIPQPIFATLPWIMAADGKRKLSKRDGAKDVLDYIREGYLPEALLSFMATLGWNDGTTQEVFTSNELIKKFSLERVGKSGAHFDERRLLWVNGHFIRELPLDDLYKKVTDYWPEEAKGAEDKYKLEVLGVVQERLKFLGELGDLTRFFFVDLPVDPNLISSHKQLSKLSNDQLKQLLLASREALSESGFAVQDLTNVLNDLLKSTNQTPAILFSLIRIATTQAPSSPGLANTLAILGKDKTLSRIDATCATL